MTSLVLLTLATFWAWMTFRFILREFKPVWYGKTRAVHPFLVLAFPLVILWPDYIAAMAVTAVVGVLQQTTSAIFEGSGEQPVIVPRRAPSRGLPPLPG